ncbi:MAG TPA: hypothetical protein VK210_08025 [Terriglobia bacterium]|nr:hypothetical protein [Terriglobia bacterium]
MGRDKATLEWKHHTLLDHMVQLLSTIASPVRIVGQYDLPTGRNPHHIGGDHSRNPCRRFPELDLQQRQYLGRLAENRTINNHLHNLTLL